MCPVKLLTRELCETHVAILVRLENILRREMGTRYSHEDWGLENFLWDLPGKWRLSQLFCRDETIFGFLIASAKGDVAHIHRFGVKPEVRGGGIAGLLFDHFVERAREAGLQGITVFAAAENARAIAFYEKKGCTVQREQQLAAIIAGRQGIEVDLLAGRIVENGAYHYVCLGRSLVEENS